MKMRRINKFFTAVFVFALLVLSATLSLNVLGVIDFAPFDNANEIDNENIAVASTSTTLSYGMFAENAKYTFTDRTKVATYRASADGVGTDLTTITVSYTIGTNGKVANHGSQENPYVIDNFNGWRKFASDMAENSSSTYTYGKDQYYVLAFDPNFSASGAPTATPIYCFGGTFYGLGHTITNFNVNENIITGTHSYSTGLFRYTYWQNSTTTTITDINLQCNYSTMTDAFGGIVGWTESYHNWVLNCHVKGSFARSTAKNYWCHGGGIVGGNTLEPTNEQNVVNTHIYRCSADVEMTIPETSGGYWHGFGGIMGYSEEGGNVYIWDCYGIATVNVPNLEDDRSGGLVGSAILSYFVGGSLNGKGGYCEISGCAGKVVNNLSGTGYWAHGSVLTMRESRTVTAATTSLIENIYVSGNIKSSGPSGNNVKLYPWVSVNQDKKSTSNNKSYLKTTGDLVCTGETAAGGWFPWFYNATSNPQDGLTHGNIASGSSSATLLGSGTASGETSLWQRATGSTSKLKTKIWTQRNNIGKTYSIQDSPVINKFKTSAFNVNYYDAKSDGTSVAARDTNTFNSMDTPTLLPPTETTGRKWLGYTFNRNNTTGLIKSLSSGNYYGDIDLYAVWDADDNAVTKSISVSGGQDENGTQVADYGSSITLTANISMAAMGSDCTIEYEWRKEGSSRASFNGQTAVIQNIADSGTYNLYYKITSTVYPLWKSSDWRYAGQKSVRIDGLAVQLNRDTFNVTKAFIGMPMGEIEYFAEFLNSSHSVMAGGTVTWSGGANAKITKDDAGFEERDGKFYYKTSFTYTPSSANSNYKVTTFNDIEFEVLEPSIVFNMDGINTPISVSANYDAEYSAFDIANLFEKAFLANLSEGTDTAYNKVKELVPCFVIGTKEVEIDDYRTTGADITVKGYYNFNVVFNPKTYVITFSYIDNNKQTQTHTENHKYGDLLSTPQLNLPTGWVIENNEWKFTDTENNERPWRFTSKENEPADRVTKSVTLSAKAVELHLVLQRIEITPRNSYTALTEITSDNLAVVAHYIIDGTNEPYEIPLTLGDGNGTTFKAVVVGSPSGRLRVDYKDVKVSHKYGNVELEETVTLNVVPIVVDTSNCGFADATVKYGADISASLPKVRNLPTGIKSVSYIYLDESDAEITVDEITGDPNRNVSYTIVAKFETSSNDYSVQDMTVSFKVTAAAEEVYLVWDINETYTLTYNGQIQFPKAKVYRVEDNSELTDVTLEYNGDIEKILPGTNYKVTATIDSAYIIRTGDESCAFSIVQAVLPVPTFEAGSMTYNGTEQTVVLTNFNDSIMSMSGMSSATNAGDYSVTVMLADNNYVFENGQNSIDIDWSIGKAMLTIVWDKYRFEVNGNIQHPQITRVDGFVAGDSFVPTDFILSGDDDKSEVGSYEVNAIIVASASWAENYQIRNPKRIFAILPEGLGNVTLITVDWSNTSLVYNGEVQYPNYTITDLDGNPITDVELTLSGDYNSSKWAGNYKVTVTASDGYYIVVGRECDYEIMVNADGEGENPNNSGLGDDGTGGSNGVGDFFEKLLASNFPLWQVATMAVAGLLSVIFLIKAVQYGNRAKKAKNETKKISAKAYASILPVFSTEVVALGLENKIWSIMAFAMCGLAVAMFAVALITRHSWKKAELAKENALDEREQRKEAKQLEREEAQEARQLALQEKLVQAQTVSQGGDYSNFEEILRQRDEQHRREIEEMREERRREEEVRRQEMDAMKMMFANMMGRGVGDDGNTIYASLDDTDMLVQRVIAGLLPAMQQMMPEATAYLAAPNSDENEELKALVEEQNEEIRNMAEVHSAEMQAMTAKMDELQEQLAAMAQDRVDGVIIADGSDEKMAEMADTMREQLAKIEELQAQLDAMNQERVDGVLLPDQSDDMKAMAEAMQQQLAKLDELQAQLAASSQDDGEGIVIPDQSEEIKALTEQIAAMREQLAERPKTITNTVYVEREADDDDDDEEEEWDSILDDDDDDFIEAVVVEEDGSVKKVSPNFRMRLKESSDKNREWYAAIKNLFCSQKGVTYRVYKRVEKIRYQGQVIAVIGIAKRSIKLWLALKPYEYDARRYHHKDVSDKPRFVDVPLYVRVGSDRALTRAQELILALFQEQNMEARKRYTDRSIQELIFTLKYNKLLTNKQYKSALCQVVHVHDCNVLDDETAEKCIETKNVDFIDESVIEQVKLDDIDANFQDGNRVTLEKLRKAGLVSEECTGYTVVADKRLTKPLIIVANDFTLDAIKMIALTGGRVIKLAQVAQQR